MGHEHDFLLVATAVRDILVDGDPAAPPSIGWWVTATTRPPRNSFTAL